MIVPGFAGSGNSILGRPSERSPRTSIEAAPTSCVPPVQVIERDPADLPPPQLFTRLSYPWLAAPERTADRRGDRYA